MLIRYAALWVLLGGCTSQGYNFQTEPVTVTVKEGVTRSKEELGYAKIKRSNGVVVSCEITLKQYPICLLHEIRHCLEGDWHPRDEPNTEDC